MALSTRGPGPGARDAGLRARVEEIGARTDAFAAAHLDAEYAALCRRMADALAELRPSPLERGAVRTWAAGIVDAVGWVNFLADPSQTPHLPTAELARLTGVGQSTLAAYRRTIRDALDLVRMDPTWTRPSRLADNPLAWIVEVDGLPVDARDLPRPVQEAAFRQGLIPFVPEGGDADEDDGDDAGDVDSARAAELAGLWADVHAAFARALGGDGSDADGAADAHLADAVGEVAADYNRRPQTDLGGLSPDAVQRLLDADWESAGSAVRLDDGLPPDDVAEAGTLRDARWLLGQLAVPNGVKATPKGNLPRAVVAAFVAHAGATNGVDLSEGEGAELVGFVRGQPNEEDVWRLHHARLLLELAGLVKRRRGVWSRTRRGDQLAAPERAGALFAALVRTHFRRFNLEYVDGVGAAPGFQYTVGYTLYQFGRVGAEWRRPAALADLVLLPSVRHEVPPRGPAETRYDPMALALETRVLRPLVGFGLAEAQAPPREPGAWEVAPSSYRKAPLFGRMFRFTVGGGL